MRATGAPQRPLLGENIARREFGRAGEGQVFPKPVVSQLEGICRKVTSSPAYIESAKGLLQVPSFLPAAQFKARIASTYKTHASLVPDLKLERN